MNFIRELIQYYKRNISALFLVFAIGIFIIGPSAMIMYVTYMRTKSILIARSIGVILFLLVTTIHLWGYNWKFICGIDISKNDKIKYYIIAQVLSMLPVLVISIILSMFVSE